MDYFYAEIDENNICTGLSQLSGEVDNSKIIRLTEDEYTQNFIGHKYEKGKWSKERVIEQTEPIETTTVTNEELKELQMMQLQILLESTEEQRKANLLNLGVTLELAELIITGGDIS